MSGPPQLERLFAGERRRLWGLAYRMTGSTSDADDVVQETFARALDHPPAGGERDDAAWRPWLVRIAVNLAHDVYRRRRRRDYGGVWLPAALETDAAPELDPANADGGDWADAPDARYARLESVTVAFLVALEALTPRQRAVLLLRDVFDYSVRETAAALDLSEANVKVLLHRARAAMAAYDRAPTRPDAALCARTQAVLARFVTAVGSDDVGAVEALLADDARGFGDGGGEFSASREPVVGGERLARFYWTLGRHNPASAVEVRVVNGLPALLLRFPPGRPGIPERLVMHVQLDAADRIVAIRSVMARPKLHAIRS
ncbi:MAG TPA: sigma-70 family RNA polymerase sigma factor [Polyangia bacterium]|nr:sigma-70 family RNA polymerase sigma factor [Polyangia bacterium]